MKKTRNQRDGLAIAVVAMLVVIALALMAFALAWEPARDFLVFWFYVLALLASG